MRSKDTRQPRFSKLRPLRQATAPEWVTLEDVAGIIRSAARGAENKGGLTECSQAALDSWAEVIERNIATLRLGVQDGGENAAVIATVLGVTKATS